MLIALKENELKRKYKTTFRLIIIIKRNVRIALTINSIFFNSLQDLQNL